MSAEWGELDPNEVYVATFADGSQVLIRGNTAAVRSSRWQTWGPPVELEAAP